MNQTLFDSDTESKNEQSFVNLPAGKHAYRILKMALTEKGRGVQGAFSHLTTGKRYTHYFGIFEEGVKGVISKSDMKALWEATKLSGSIGLDRLPNFTDKVVEIDAYESDGTEGRKFTNIRSIHPYDGPAPASKFNQPEDPDDKINTDPSPAPATKAAAPAASAPATTAPGKKWKDRVKK